MAELILTDRQREVAEALARGLSMQEIGDELEISRSAVKQHCDVLRRKLGVDRVRHVGQAYRDLNGSAA